VTPGKQPSPHAQARKGSDSAAITPRSDPFHLADLAEALFGLIEHEVLVEGRRADRSIAHELAKHSELSLHEQYLLTYTIFSAFRWRGWFSDEAVPLPSRLLLATLLDGHDFEPIQRVWTSKAGYARSRLALLTPTSSLDARARATERILGLPPRRLDAWLLVPEWFRAEIAEPPGVGGLGARALELLESLQTPPPFWVRARETVETQVWSELRTHALDPRIHASITSAAVLPREADVMRLPPYERGDLEIQDLASQCVGAVCDPDPGERWWDVCAGAGGKALHLAERMRVKGLVIATDTHNARLREAARRARRSPLHNITTRVRVGEELAGKAGSFDGVLVDAPCSGLGTWRRNPEARWTTQRESIARLAELQFSLLQSVTRAVKPGGTIVYAVCTFTRAETTDVVARFLRSNTQFRLDPFPNPLSSEKTDGTLAIWPRDGDCDGMFIARLVRG
jgi:16S rRNA (cytosine967-C5)-methyltransferase